MAEIIRGTARSVSTPPREARLRGWCAAFYPGVPAEEWIRAEQLVALVAGEADWAEGGEGRPYRALSEVHFEFRGGPPPGHGWSGVATRKTDDPCTYESD